MSSDGGSSRSASPGCEDKESEVKRALKALVAKAAEAKRARDASRPLSERAESVQRVVRSLHRAYDFHPGDVVKWKPGLQNRKSPPMNTPAVVVSLVSPPVHDRDALKEPNSVYYREPLDVVIGTVAEDGDLVCLHYDSRRWMPYDEPVESPDGQKPEAPPAGQEVDEESVGKLERLRRLVGRLGERDEERFKVGDVVVWKKGLRNKPRPKVTEVAVVVEVVEPPVKPNVKEAGKRSFHEALDIKLGLVDTDGDLLFVHAESCRLTHLVLPPAPDPA